MPNIISSFLLYVCTANVSSCMHGVCIFFYGVVRCLFVNVMDTESFLFLLPVIHILDRCSGF